MQRLYLGLAIEPAICPAAVYPGGGSQAAGANALHQPDVASRTEGREEALSSESDRHPLTPLPPQPGDMPWPTEVWPRAELDVRVDRDLLDRTLDHAFAQPESLGTTNAMVIVHRGAIVRERYADGLDATTTHVSWSMAKSMLHAAIGTLAREGRIDVAAVTDDPGWRAAGDPRGSITIDQLLKMRSGLLFHEDYVDEHTSHVIEMLFGAGKPDAAAYAAALPLDHEPGSVFHYSSGTSNILSAMVARVLGARGDAYRKFLHRELWDRLGMKSAKPRFDEAGHWIASSFVFATAQDFARFGLLYLRDGVWAGGRILPEGWVDYARTYTGTDEETGLGYGAHWWLVPGNLGTFRCSGYNGQRIIVVPPLDLVVVRLGVSPIDLAPELERFSQQTIDAFRPLLDES